MQTLSPSCKTIILSVSLDVPGQSKSLLRSHICEALAERRNMGYSRSLSESYLLRLSHANPRQPISALYIAVCSANQPAQREVFRVSLVVDASRNPRVRVLALKMAELVVALVTSQLRA